MGCLLHWREEMGCERAASPACTARDARRTVSAQLPRQWERHDRQRLRPACRPARGRRVGSRQRQRPPCDSRRRDEASSRQRPWPQQRAASVAPALRGRGAAQQRGPGRARARRALSVSAAADRPAGKVCPDMCSPDRPASPRAAPDSGRLQAQGRPPPAPAPAPYEHSALERGNLCLSAALVLEDPPSTAAAGLRATPAGSPGGIQIAMPSGT